MKPIECIEQITHNRLVRTGLAFSAALSMAHEVLTPPAEAAGPVCNPQKKDYQYTIAARMVPFYDIGGKEKIFDRAVDPWIEFPITGGTLRVIDPITGGQLAEANLSEDKPNISYFTPRQGESNVAWSVLNWQGKCDTEVEGPTQSGKSKKAPGKKIVIVASQDPNNKSFEGVIGSGGTGIVWTGRRYKTAESFLQDLKRFPGQGRNLPAQVLEDIRQAAAKEKSIVPPKISPIPSMPQKPTEDKKDSEFPWTAAAIAFAGAAIGTGLFLARRRGNCDDRNTGNTLRGSAPYEIRVNADPYRGQVNLQTTGTLTDSRPTQGGQRI